MKKEHGSVVRVKYCGFCAHLNTLLNQAADYTFEAAKILKILVRHKNLNPRWKKYNLAEIKNTMKNAAKDLDLALVKLEHHIQLIKSLLEEHLKFIDTKKLDLFLEQKRRHLVSFNVLIETFSWQTDANPLVYERFLQHFKKEALNLSDLVVNYGFMLDLNEIGFNLKLYSPARRLTR